MKTRLEQGLSALHLSPTPSGTLERYCSLLLEQNQMMNLTAITDPDQVVDLHMLDSAALLTVDDFSGKKVIDVGTGAGFPGMVLKVLEPTIQLTLLDSLGKRMNWLSELSAQLGAAPVECIHGRAEEQALLEGYRDCYDLAVSRAVADLRILAERRTCHRQAGRPASAYGTVSDPRNGDHTARGGCGKDPTHAEGVSSSLFPYEKGSIMSIKRESDHTLHHLKVAFCQVFMV